MTAPRRCSLRFAIVAVVCLLLGAATAVGVALCLFLYPLVGGGSKTVSPANWPAPVPDSWPQPNFAYLDWDAGGSERIASAYRYVDGQTPEEIGSVWVVRRGWPFRALESRRYSSDFRELDEWPGGVHGVSLACLPHPVLPYWPGLIVDAGLFGGAWYVLLFGPGWAIREYVEIRGTARRRGGKCRDCGYDLKGAPTGPCPECGHSPAKS